MMQLTTYDKYKDSGIEWLGEVPEHWDEKRCKDILIFRGGFAFNSNDYFDEGIQLILIGNLYKNNLSLDRNPTFVPVSYLDSHSKYIVSKGDILISLTGTLGKKDYGFSIQLKSNQKYLLNQRVGCLNTKRDYLSNWIIYLLQSNKYVEELLSLPKGTKQGNLSETMILSISVPIPPTTEQTLIATYLDQATTKIDKKIDLLTQKIKHYQDLKTALINQVVTKGLDDGVEMKDSEIKWLGKAPCHWKEIRFKQVFKKKSKRTNLMLNCGSISFGEVVFKDNDSIPTERRETYQEVLKGEFLINPLNLNFDLKSLRTALSAKDVIVSSGYIVLQSNKSYDKDYLRWLLHEFDVSTMKNLGAGIRQTLRFDDVGSSIFFTPPINEQKKIGDYLNQKTSTIDKIIATITTQVKHQKELRKTLINDVVTGKVKIENN